jgi:hypothetical protein
MLPGGAREGVTVHSAGLGPAPVRGLCVGLLLPQSESADGRRCGGLPIYPTIEAILGVYPRRDGVLLDANTL